VCVEYIIKERGSDREREIKPSKFVRNRTERKRKLASEKNIREIQNFKKNIEKSSALIIKMIITIRAREQDIGRLQNDK
jgi:hypothetical protein